MAKITKFVKECKAIIRDELVKDDMREHAYNEYSAGYIDGLLKAMELLGQPLSLSVCIRAACSKFYLPRKGRKYCSESCRQLAYRSRKVSA